jgi:anti-anti-sigma factor
VIRWSRDLVLKVPRLVRVVAARRASSSDDFRTGAVHDSRVLDGLHGHDVPSAPTEPPRYGELTLTSTREGDVHSIHLFGELDLASAERVEHELMHVERSDARVIILDLSGLAYMGSTGVELLLSAHARSLAGRSRLALVRGPAEVQRVFELCSVDDLLPFL